MYKKTSLYHTFIFPSLIHSSTPGNHNNQDLGFYGNWPPFLACEGEAKCLCQLTRKVQHKAVISYQSSLTLSQRLKRCATTKQMNQQHGQNKQKQQQIDTLGLLSDWSLIAQVNSPRGPCSCSLIIPIKWWQKWIQTKLQRLKVDLKVNPHVLRLLISLLTWDLTQGSVWQTFDLLRNQMPQHLSPMLLYPFFIYIYIFPLYFPFINKTLIHFFSV